ncbi:hypothetical protein F4777DRAFT_348646 [Nemania sp. FL0916]|nr:hypothetical protein F4777DRAFT_348646 [Nemania sp. FL0916]
MAHPKKRKRPNAPAEFATNCPSHKKRKKHRSSYAPENPRVRHPVLSRYYPRVQTLREFVIAQLPSSSRIRRKKVSVVGVISKSHELPLSDVERSLGTLLDATFVGIPETTPEQEASRMNEWKQFSEKGDESYVTLSNGTTRFVEAQALIVEYVVKTIFDKEKSAKWPDHLLCDGFRRNGGLGLRVLRPNPCVELLQQSPWPQLLALLGEAGDRIMIDLLLNCAVFVPVEVGASNVCQISGMLTHYLKFF